jgi:hypothetical protein
LKQRALDVRCVRAQVVFVSIGDSLFAAIGMKADAYIGISMCVLPAALLGWLLTLLSHVPWTVPSVDVTFTPILAEMGAALAAALAASDAAPNQHQLVPTFVAAVCICFVVVGCSLAALGSGKISSLTNLIPAQVAAHRGRESATHTLLDEPIKYSIIFNNNNAFWLGIAFYYFFLGGVFVSRWWRGFWPARACSLSSKRSA